MSRIDIEYLMDRYLNGEASAQEIEQVESWLEQHGNSQSGWDEMDKASRGKWLDSLYADIQASAGINDLKVIRMRPAANLWRGVAAVAAMLAIFFTIYLEWPLLHSKLYPDKLVAIKVPANQQRQVILSDGSKISLNSASQLKYPKAFNGKTREVYLSGEAYFDIEHNAAKPFIIHTGKVITTVLGTAFNIKEDSRQHTVIVTVTRGKVSVANGGRALGVITPNQQISFNTVSYQHSQRMIDVKPVIAWLESDVHFDDITFAAVALQLQQRFNVKISFANEKIKSCRFTGTALKADKLDKILNVLCAFNNATYRTEGNGNIVIDGPGCK
jgi:transmembrane sensor